MFSHRANGVLSPIGSRGILHIALHFLVPLALALVFYRNTWRASLAQMLLGLVIDLDHLLANPVYDPDRCSIGFHPLHGSIPIALYTLALLHPRTRLVGIGLCVHIILDTIDCGVTSGLGF